MTSPLLGPATWGRFLRRDRAAREDLAVCFVQRVEGLRTVPEAATCFPYQVFAARGNLQDFFAFYHM